MVMNVENNQPNRVVEFFANKTILITGGSGFLGKVLIEKLLRSCTQLKKIYVLMRPKKGICPSERLQQIVEGPLYETVKQQHGKAIFDKLEVIVGDMEAADLNISPEDRQKIIDEVEIIYHSAATVQFDDPLKKSVFLNVRGVKLMLQLAKECKKLLVYSHISTAYCQENQKVLLEKTYPPPCNPHRVIDMCEWLDEKTLEIIGEKIRGSSANTYTFTKALGEGLVAEQMDHLPIIMQRPPAVISTWKEPIRGWTDNIYGPTGLLLGAGKGVIRTMYGKKEYFADYCSVDIIANGLITSAYDYATYGTRRVYNFTASDEVKVTFEEILDVGRKLVTEKIPFDWMLWYPGGDLTDSKVLHLINFFLFQLLPAFLIDSVLFILGFRPFLVRIQKKIWRGYKIFNYYANRQWDFRKENMTVVRNYLNENEKKMFFMVADNLDLEEYFCDCILGLRRYILHEKDENIPAAKRRIKVLWLVDKLYKFLLYFGLSYLVVKFFVAPYFAKIIETYELI